MDPHAVIRSGPNTTDPGLRPAWVMPPTDPTRPARICIGERYSERVDPTVKVLLEIVDEVEEQLAEKGGDLLTTGCKRTRRPLCG